MPPSVNFPKLRFYFNLYFQAYLPKLKGKPFLPPGKANWAL
jgi:hypothetical protein